MLKRKTIEVQFTRREHEAFGKLCVDIERKRIERKQEGEDGK